MLKMKKVREKGRCGMRKGFTLIELLIVIAIVAILAGAMIPMINVTREDARQAKAAADMDAVKTAAIMLHHDTGTWPPAGSVGSGLLSSGGAVVTGWSGPYLDQWISDPWGSSYEVTVTGGATGPVAVLSRGANPDISLTITPNRSI